MSRRCDGRVPALAGSHHAVENGQQLAQAGSIKKRTFESTLVITVRKPRREPKAGVPQSRKASSPTPTVNTGKQKPAKTTGNGKPAAQVTAIKPKRERRKDGLTKSKPATSEALKKLRRGEVPEEQIILF